MASKALVDHVYGRILSNFPIKNRLALAYGSAVFRQQGHKDPSKNMLDFIFVVDDPVLWHDENISKNPSHYSYLKHLGSRYVSNIQDKYGAGIYFNTLVKCENRLIKYGVISTKRLISDLLDWDTLYVSGRLHKPIMIHQNNSDLALSAAFKTNLQNAMHTALLLLPDHFTEEQLYLCICGLSYAGDFRMTVGEDKNKVSNIVRPNMEHFRKLYLPLIQKENHVNLKSSGILEQSLGNTSRYHHLNLLPKTLIENLVNFRNKDGRHRDTEEVIRSLCNDPDCDEIVKNCVVQIVKGSSLSQSIKGIFTAGVVKSVKYSTKKIKKMLNGRMSRTIQ